MTDIVIINKSARITAADLTAAVAAFQTQINRDFAPVWNASATLHLDAGPPGVWNFFLQDGLDQPGDLGYHMTDNGTPEAKIDIAGAIDSGNDWRTVVSHELLEALADPMCLRMAPDGSTIVEVCDPVEESLYLIDGLAVSNFVFPQYFGIPTTASNIQFDFNNQLTAPAPALLSGGYIMQYVNGQWVSHFGRKVSGALGWMATRPNGRSTLRASRPRPTI